MYLYTVFPKRVMSYSLKHLFCGLCLWCGFYPSTQLGRWLMTPLLENVHCCIMSFFPCFYSSKSTMRQWKLTTTLQPIKHGLWQKEEVLHVSNCFLVIYLAVHFMCFLISLVYGGPSLSLHFTTCKLKCMWYFAFKWNFISSLSFDFKFNFKQKLNFYFICYFKCVCKVKLKKY